ncbi:MAG TPA: S8 family serine peptidase [Chryseosolibacter sp.]|nr:S8 family serine peptidase [Chryseosolibacter sp.]
MNSVAWKFLLITSLFFTACDEEKETVNEIKIEDESCLTATGTSKAGTIIPGEYIVTVDESETPGHARSAAVSVLSRHKIEDRVLEKIEGMRRHYRMKLTDEQATTLKNDIAVKNVEPDRIISICGCFSVQEPRSVTWNIDKVGYGDGAGKTAWIIDTGIDSSHPDLLVDKGRSKSFMDTGTFDDDNGHGTHIGGVIGALNNDIGTLGVASGATLVALKVLDKNGDGKLSGLLNALSHVRQYGKAGDVVNISIGFDEFSSTLENEITSIASRGIYFSLAAGNESSEANAYSPARIAGNNIYTVSAIDSLDRFASFSNYGNDVVDFAAPGVKILSSYKEGKYAILSGTSMAAPHVAGLLLINNGKINSNGYAVSDPDGSGDPIAHK